MNSFYTTLLINQLIIDEEYSLNEIATIIDFQPVAITRKGVVTKTGENFIILLVNLEKRPEATQYTDKLVGSTLIWDAQENNKFAEKYITDGTHETFVFIQNKSKSPFKYYGRAIPLRMKYSPQKGIPSIVIFSLDEYEKAILSINDIATLDMLPPLFISRINTRKTFHIQRTSQGLYRDKALNLWNNCCAVSEVSNPKILVASHIKPWREASNSEQEDPYNSIVLSPNYTKLFDLGFISFKPSNGKILLSEQLRMQDWEALKINDSIALRMLPSGIEKFLKYHNDYIFDFEQNMNLEEKALLI
jgi:hypothetical protein